MIAWWIRKACAHCGAEHPEADPRLARLALLLVPLLEQTLAELHESNEAIGGCDHAVGICSCDSLFLEEQWEDVVATARSVGLLPAKEVKP